MSFSRNPQWKSENWRGLQKAAVVYPLLASELNWHREKERMAAEIKRLRSEVGLTTKRLRGAQREVQDMVTRLRAQPPPPVPNREPPPPPATPAPDQPTTIEHAAPPNVAKKPEAVPEAMDLIWDEERPTEQTRTPEPTPEPEPTPNLPAISPPLTEGAWKEGIAKRRRAVAGASNASYEAHRQWSDIDDLKGEGEPYSEAEWEKKKEKYMKAEARCKDKVQDIADWVEQGRKEWKEKMRSGGRR